MNVEAEILDLKRAVFGGNDIGESEEDYAFEPIDIPNNQWYSTGSVTLTKGKYLVIYGAAFANNANGSRQLHFAVNSSTAGRFSPSVAAVSGEQTRMSAATTYEVGTDTATLVLWAKQNSGGDLRTWGYVRVLKL